MLARSFNANDLFFARKCPARDGAPSWLNLDFGVKPGLSALPWGGCGLYCAAFDGQLIYVGKFQGQVSNPFGGNILEIRWRRHIQSLTMRGEAVSVGLKTLRDAHHELPSGEVLSGLMGAHRTYLIRDRGFHASRNRVKFAARHWSALREDPAVFLPLFEFGYVQIEPGELAGRAETSLRQRVSLAEVQARAELSPPCNGESRFEASILRAGLSMDATLERLRHHLAAVTQPGGTLRHAGTDTPAIETRNTRHDPRPKTGRLITLTPDQQELETEISMEKIEDDLPDGWPTDWLQQLKTQLPADSMEVHATATGPRGDVRVRALNLKRARNVFTMQWQPTKNMFLCRILLDEAHAQACPGVIVRRADANNPLKTAFSFDGSNPSARAGLLQLIHDAVQRAKEAGL